MAKKSMMERDKRRRELAAKYAVRRSELRAAARDARLPIEEREAAAVQLQKLPRDSSPIRARNRCRMTGRPRGYYRKFGLSRNKLREVIMFGDVPGVVKASW